jgi:hypothetical protein
VFLARVGEPAASQPRRSADSASVLLDVEDAGPGTDAARRSTAGGTRGAEWRPAIIERDLRDGSKEKVANRLECYDPREDYRRETRADDVGYPPFGGGEAEHAVGRLPWVRSERADNFVSLSAMTWQIHVYGAAKPELVKWCAYAERRLRFLARRPSEPNDLLSRLRVPVQPSGMTTQLPACGRSIQQLARSDKGNNNRVGTETDGRYYWLPMLDMWTDMLRLGRLAHDDR